MPVILFALFIVAVCIYLGNMDVKNTEFFDKINGMECAHKTIKGRFIIVGFDFADNTVNARCENGKTKWFAYKELIMPKNNQEKINLSDQAS